MNESFNEHAQENTGPDKELTLHIAARKNSNFTLTVEK